MARMGVAKKGHRRIFWRLSSNQVVDNGLREIRFACASLPCDEQGTGRGRTHPVLERNVEQEPVPGSQRWGNMIAKIVLCPAFQPGHECEALLVDKPSLGPGQGFLTAT